MGSSVLVCEGMENDSLCLMPPGERAAFNATSLLTEDQAEWEEETTTSPDAMLWDEVFIPNYCLYIHKLPIQAMCRAIEEMVLQERARGLNLNTISTREKEKLPDTHSTSQWLFGAVVTMMQKKCEEKQDDEPLNLSLPRWMLFPTSTTTLPVNQTYTNSSGMDESSHTCYRMILFATQSHKRSNLTPRIRLSHQHPVCENRKVEKM